MIYSVFSRSIMDHFTDDTNLKLAAKKLVTIDSITNNTLIANNELKHLVQWLRGFKLSLLRPN